MEAHDSPVGKVAQHAVGLLPDALRQAPRPTRWRWTGSVALHTALKAVRRGGTVSLSGVYGGEVDPLPMMEMFDKRHPMRMGQCHVARWTDDLLPLVARRRRPAGRPGPHHPPPAAGRGAPTTYEIFQKKQDDCIKVVLHP